MRVNWREDGESRSERKTRVRMNGGWGQEMKMEGARCIYKEGEMEVAWRDSERELERIFERNMATHVSKTSALCKNNLSNYEERLLAFLSGMLYCTPRLIPHLPPHIYVSCIYLDAVIYCL